MTKNKGDLNKEYNRSVLETIRNRKKRKEYARRHRPDHIWFGLGMFGLIGWSVAVPTIVLTLAGIWIDASFKSRFSWTLMMITAGIILGCLNAWFWIKKEEEAIRRERDLPDDTAKKNGEE
ncbi:MAG: AtpZ/AtpI family protein [Spirochaetales bacterium]|nr:AtpZ/AtpI family protein [Spirochaetales bacterium]